MKKFLMFVCACLVCVAAVAGNPLKVVSGKDRLKALMKEKTTVAVQFDWSHTQYDNKMPVAEKWADDYDFIVRDCQGSFVAAFNEKSKYLTMQEDAEGAKYFFIITVDNVDEYFAVMRFVPKHEAKVWGSLKIVAVGSGDVVAEVKIDEAEDGADFVVKECYGKTFGKLGERIAKLK